MLESLDYSRLSSDGRDFQTRSGQTQGPGFLDCLIFPCRRVASWEAIGTTKAEDKKVLNRRLGVAVALTVAAVSVIAIRRFFNRERRFSKKLTCILVMRIAGDDASKLASEGINRES